MFGNGGLCSRFRPATLGGLNWILVPKSTKEGASVKDQEAVIERAATIREMDLKSHPHGSHKRFLASNRERVIRADEWYWRCLTRGYDDGEGLNYCRRAHYTLVSPD